MLSLTTISIIAFYAVIALIIYKNRHKVQRQGIFLLYRTKRGVNTINRLAKYKRFWKAWGYFAVPVGYIGMIFIVVELTRNIIKYITDPTTSPGVSIVIPGVHVPGSEIFVPFWYGVVSLVLLIVVHEGSHGVIARAHGIKVKNTGIGMFLFLPLAFVEPDEKQMKKQPFKVQASVFAAGSFANFVLAGLAILLTYFIISPAAAAVIQLDGIETNDVLEGFPAEQAGLKVGDVITSINSVTINHTSVLSEEMSKINPGGKVTLGVSGRDIVVTTIASPKDESLAYLGVSFIPKINLKPEIEDKYWKLPWVLIILANFLMWTFLLNLGIGLFNLLPLGFVDGGRMAQAAFKRFIKKEKLATKLFTYISLFALFILLLNIFGPAIF